MPKGFPEWQCWQKQSDLCFNEHILHKGRQKIMEERWTGLKHTQYYWNKSHDAWRLGLRQLGRIEGGKKKVLRFYFSQTFPNTYSEKDKA